MSAKITNTTPQLSTSNPNSQDYQQKHDDNIKKFGFDSNFKREQQLGGLVVQASANLKAAATAAATDAKANGGHFTTDDLANLRDASASLKAASAEYSKALRNTELTVGSEAQNDQVSQDFGNTTDAVNANLDPAAQAVQGLSISANTDGSTDPTQQGSLTSTNQSNDELATILNNPLTTSAAYVGNGQANAQYAKAPDKSYDDING